MLKKENLSNLYFLQLISTNTIFFFRVLIESLIKNNLEQGTEGGGYLLFLLEGMVGVIVPS